MLAAALIIFREVFEIVLIVGIVLAATRTIPGRLWWVVGGFAGGLAGAGLVAAFTDQISAFAEGVGQELFNAGILFVAAFFIGWTVLWMSRHGREMKAHFAKVGDHVLSGTLPFYSLSIAIALAMWREGSEIVLFGYGMLATGQPLSSLLLGGLIGGAAGMVVGLLMYFGLISLPTKYFLRITSALLVLLVAGMMAQGTGFLVAAGYFESLSATAWDSSWLLEDQGVFGQALHALIGYTARPAKIQVLVYLLTIGALFMSIRSGRTSARQPSHTLASLCLLLAGSALLGSALPSDAFATKKVYSPYVEAGEMEVEWRGNYTLDDDDNKDGQQKNLFALGYGMTDHWFSELYAEVEKSATDGSDYEFSALEWENRFQIFEPGEHWLDLGLYTAYKVALEEDTPDKAEVKLLLAKNVGSFTHYANLILEKEVGAHAEDGTEAGIAWSTRYRYQPWLEPGFEVHSDFGPLSESKPFEEQKHQVGPALYGALPGGFKYDVGYLFGVSDAAPDGELKWILEYELRF